MFFADPKGLGATLFLKWCQRVPMVHLDRWGSVEWWYLGSWQIDPEKGSTPLEGVLVSFMLIYWDI